MTDEFERLKKNKLTESDVRWRRAMSRRYEGDENPLEIVEIIVGSQGSIIIKPIGSDSEPSLPQPT